MKEKDYITLQTLLAKLRVEAMKEMGNTNNTTKVREKSLRIIRNIDYLRNNAMLDIKEVQNDDERVAHTRVISNGISNS